jgi:hypothetical protein
MTDLTGRLETPNFARRDGPEQWDDDEVVTSEGDLDVIRG